MWRNIASNFLTITIVLLIGVAVLVAWARDQYDSAGPLAEAICLKVESGSTMRRVADDLASRGAVSSSYIFKVGADYEDKTTRVKAGSFLIGAHASMRDVMDLLIEGKTVAYRITIPEGLTSEQVLACLTADSVPPEEDIPGLTDDQEERCAEAASALVGPAPPVPPEGAVLPDTYAFSRGDTRANILNLMMRERDRVITEVWARRAPDLPITTIDELATLASIVEKETSLADERTRVAAVFINRLRLDMRLQSDPTFIYGIYGGAGKPDGYVATAKDRDTPTPYNTYTIDGLPPGPIANPGRAALEAVANPSRTRDLFFVADGTGGHAFAETYEEHLRNVARWRQINADGGAGGGEEPAGGEEPMALQEPDQ